ncbi:hypothetical protein OBBRIDRAFT_785696 [Obba rivulosa]|uniref:G protein-coupled receptor n=1 Tax=Obba rivulosa TaxID=1052685 RepID=A0A8E2AT72_9APHY|nr:hypothetical protein OBBRIDRAFT_785696 [Obba rivulosa]
MSPQGLFTYQPGQAQTLAVIVVFALLSMLAIFYVLLRFSWGFLSHWYRSAEVGEEPREKFFFRTQLGAYTASLLFSNFVCSTSSVVDTKWIMLRGIQRGPTCTAQAAVSQISGVANAYFTAAVAIHTFNSLVLRKRLPTWFCGAAVAFGWICSTAAGGVPLAVFNGSSDPIYSSNGLSCGFSPEYPVLQTVLQLVPIFLASLISVVCYVLIFLFLRGTLSISDGLHVNIDPEARRSATAGTLFEYHRFIAAIARSMLWFPFAYMGLLFPLVIVSLMGLNEYYVPFSARVFADAFSSMLGFANAMILLNILRIMAPVLSQHQVVQRIQVSAGSESFFAGSKSPFVQDFKVESPIMSFAQDIPGSNTPRSPHTPRTPRSPRSPRTPRSPRVPPIRIPSRRDMAEPILLTQAISGLTTPTPRTPRTPHMPTIHGASQPGTLRRTGSIVKQLIAKRPSIKMPNPAEKSETPLLERKISPAAELNAMLSAPGLPSNPRARLTHDGHFHGLPPPRRTYRSPVVREPSYEALPTEAISPPLNASSTGPRTPMDSTMFSRSSVSSAGHSRATSSHSTRYNSTHESLFSTYTDRSQATRDSLVPPVPRLPDLNPAERSTGARSTSVDSLPAHRLEDPVARAASSSSDESSGESSSDHSSTAHLVNAGLPTSPFMMDAASRSWSHSRSRARQPSSTDATRSPAPSLLLGEAAAMRRMLSAPDLWAARRSSRSSEQRAQMQAPPSRARAPLSDELFGLPQMPKVPQARTPLHSRAPSAYADPFTTPTHSRQSSRASTTESLSAAPATSQERLVRAATSVRRATSPTPRTSYGYF